MPLSASMSFDHPHLSPTSEEVFIRIQPFVRNHQVHRGTNILFNEDNLKPPPCVLMWTENALNTKFFGYADFTIAKALNGIIWAPFSNDIFKRFCGELIVRVWRKNILFSFLFGRKKLLHFHWGNVVLTGPKGVRLLLILHPRGS